MNFNCVIVCNGLLHCVIPIELIPCEETIAVKDNKGGQSRINNESVVSHCCNNSRECYCKQYLEITTNILTKKYIVFDLSLTT